MNRIKRYIDSETYELSNLNQDMSDNCSTVSDEDSDYETSDSSDTENKHKLNCTWYMVHMVSSSKK